MKDIAIISIHEEHGESIKNDLLNYFKDYNVVINIYTTDEIKKLDILNEKCILVVNIDVFEKVKLITKESSKIVINRLTIKKENLRKLTDIPKKSKVLVANINFRNCMEVISNLYSSGFKEYEYIPYYNVHEDYDYDIKFAITTNEMDMVPKDIERVIDLDERICSVSSIIEVANALDIKDFPQNEKTRAMLSTESEDFGIEAILGEKDGLKMQINVILELMKNGIIITDVSGVIMSLNTKAKDILKKRTSVLENYNISNVIPELDNIKSMRFISKKEEKIINVNGKNIIISYIPIFNYNIVTGFVITLDDFAAIEDKQNDYRTKINFSKHKAIYNFDDIKGDSSVINKVKETAKTMAGSNSSIMIFGESGTGKEIFAQSIHNASPRKHNNFVAVNCAAIPENLLESEMFGYEEGAFTGAKKEGKIGLFQIAHNGTLFLDEIAEMSLLMQTKLLRVIEEMQIIKIGSNKITTVDVRIITATNKNLRKLVNDGKFREDLYYRLNVLPLTIPNLRERKEDIMLLANHFIQSLGKNISFHPEAERLIKLHDWRGNIRELRNVMEYLVVLDKSIIEKYDLPFLNIPSNNNMNIETNDNLIAHDIIIRFILNEGNKIDLYKAILIELEKSYNNRERIGRKKLMNILENNNVFSSEQEIRTCLNKLDSFGFIVSKKGRAGSIITPGGIQLKNKILEFLNS